MNGENAVCTLEQCATERCPLHVARQRAEQAHIVIVNHALLLADVANENHVLPAFMDLIIDEAHHLESAVTNGLSFRADKRFLETVLEEISKPRSGLLADVQKRLGDVLPEHVSNELDAFAERMRQEAQEAVIRLDEFFAAVDFFLRDQVQASSQFAQQVRLTLAVRIQPGYDEIEISWENLHTHLKAIGKDFDKLARSLADIAEHYDVEDEEEMRAALLTNGRALGRNAREFGPDHLRAARRHDLLGGNVQRSRFASCCTAACWPSGGATYFQREGDGCSYLGDVADGRSQQLWRGGFQLSTRAFACDRCQ